MARSKKRKRKTSADDVARPLRALLWDRTGEVPRPPRQTAPALYALAFAPEIAPLVEPAFAPHSWPLFAARVATFSPAWWFGRPAEPSPLAFAAAGFSCVARHRVGCALCGAEEMLVVGGGSKMAEHLETCPWRLGGGQSPAAFSLAQRSVRAVAARRATLPAASKALAKDGWTAEVGADEGVVVCQVCRRVCSGEEAARGRAHRPFCPWGDKATPAAVAPPQAVKERARGAVRQVRRMLGLK